MTFSDVTRSPDWCTNIHDSEEFLDDHLFHGRSFGCYEDGTAGVIKIEIDQIGGEFKDLRILVDTVQMTNSTDLRDLARDCIETAEWMDKNLPQRLILMSHVN